ncbi:MAG: hypothetical protein HF981_00775, partial [Desulfobacteraceae bacterium]|nr:hypothetical protein [Desulfobacteraceae bacterium]MBC2748902.1 hypothetical protein [Desulfobacteraceae bacterium]
MSIDDLEKITRIGGTAIQELSAVIMSKVNGAPRAQLRTARFKKAVFVVDDLVYKGPYKRSDPGLMNNLRFTFAIQLLEDALHLPEWKRASLPWRCISWDGNDQYYLVAENVGKTKNIPFELESSKIEVDVPIIPRGAAVWRVSEVEKNGHLTNRPKFAALQHLYLRFLLDIGDSGTHNILVREDHVKTGRLIAGIDLEEMRTNKDRDSRLTHLFTNAFSYKKRSLYGPEVRNIQSITYWQIDQHILEKMNAVGIDLEKLKEKME